MEQPTAGAGKDKGKGAGKALAAVGAATPLASSESPRLADLAPSPPKAAAPAADPPGQVASGGGSSLPGVVIVCGLVLAFAGWQALRRLHRRRLRARLEALRSRQRADWDAAVSQIRLERTPEASKPAGRAPRRVEAGLDSGPRSARTGGATGWNYRRASGTPAKAE